MVYNHMLLEWLAASVTNTTNFAVVAEFVLMYKADVIFYCTFLLEPFTAYSTIVPMLNKKYIIIGAVL